MKVKPSRNQWFSVWNHLNAKSGLITTLTIYQKRTWSGVVSSLRNSSLMIFQIQLQNLLNMIPYRYTLRFNCFLIFPRPKPLYNIRPICSLKVQLFPLSILTAMLIISPWPELQRKLKFTIINEWSTAQSTKSTRQQWKWRASRKFHALHGISTTR